MPKNTEPKLTNRKDGRAVVHWKGKMYLMGKSGTPEAKIAYHRFCVEIQNQPVFTPQPAKNETEISISELVAGFLDYHLHRQDKVQFTHNKLAVSYLVNIYGTLAVNEFSPKKLKVVRSQMVKTGRMCRRHINGYAQRIIRVFSWGVEEELVKPDIVAALREVRSLRKGEEGTHDNPKRTEISDDIVRRTLPFMSPTVAAMVQVQRLTGMRPSEIYRMRTGDIDQSQENGLWYYVPGKHKTEEYIGEKKIPLGKPEQELILPYLEGKKPEATVFSPRTAMEEWHATRRANRKTKVSPSQAERNRQRAENPADKVGESYDSSAYRKAIEHAIRKANSTLPDGEKIPHWTPYQLRHAAGTEAEKTAGLDKAQALLGHTSANTTKRYAHGRLAITEELAKNRKNPFESEK